MFLENISRSFLGGFGPWQRGTRTRAEEIGLGMRHDRQCDFGHHGERGFLTAAIVPTVATGYLKLFKCALQQPAFGDQKAPDFP
jgi:hypothetical protein